MSGKSSPEFWGRGYWPKYQLFMLNWWLVYFLTLRRQDAKAQRKNSKRNTLRPGALASEFFLNTFLTKYLAISKQPFIFTTYSKQKMIFSNQIFKSKRYGNN
jgi:hypothetical protein